MAIKIQTKIGEHTVVVEKESLMDCFPVVAFLGEILQAAGKRRVALTYRHPKGFNYYGLVDLDTGEEMNFGQAKEGGLYVKEGWKPAYAGPARTDYDQGDPPPPENQDYEPQRTPPDQSAGRPPAQPAPPARRQTRF